MNSLHSLNKSLCEFINKDDHAIILMGFFSGLLFSGISLGFIYIILFLIFWEVLYFGYLNVNNKKWSFDFRITIILATFLGYLVGAFFHDNDDHLESFHRFKKQLSYCAKECDWKD